LEDVYIVYTQRLRHVGGEGGEEEPQPSCRCRDVYVAVFVASSGGGWAEGCGE